MNNTKHTTDAPPRRIRSFIRRDGRLTQGQQRALDELWPRYGLAPDQPIDVDKIFARPAPVTLEIGFGNGTSLAQMAAAEPEQNFIGIEVHRPGVGHLLHLLDTQNIHNVRILDHDAIEALNEQIAELSLQRVLLFFPDPWPKRKHHKRRIVQAEFIELVRRKLKSAGHLHMATDWQAYAKQMLSVMQQSSGFSNLADDNQYCARPNYRPLTKFEQRGQQLGHGVWDLLWQKT